MTLEQLLDAVRNFDDLVELAPVEGSDHPEISWGDHFFYYDPDARIPDNVQPYATIVTKDYPDNEQSALNPAGRWRVNVHVGLSRSATLTGGTPGDITASDFRAADVFLPHPVFGALGWIAVVNPGPQTESTVIELLRAAHGEARRRMDRRSDLNAVGKPAPDH